jgi:hypothetical protein
MSRARLPTLARACRAACTIALTLALASHVHAATLFDPALRFRMLPTDHFVIYFHQGEDRLAHRLAAIAEETWHTLEQPLGVTPPRLTRVVLADQVEVANGYATPVPYDTIVMYLAWPSGSEFDFDDWLRLVFTHEFTHIIHLDRSEGWSRVVRSIFGRTIFAFPNLFLPTWQIEGLATYEESAITGEGRLHAGDFRAIVGEAARRHALEPLDRVNGGLIDWPGGEAAYAYGVGFHQYLVDRFGAQRLVALADATARSIPYTGSRAFGRVYGEPLGALWLEYEASVAAGVAPAPDETHPPDASGILGQRSSIRSVCVPRLPGRHPLLGGQRERLPCALPRRDGWSGTAPGDHAIPGIDDRDRPRRRVLRSDGGAAEHRGVQRSLRMVAPDRARAATDA